MKEPMKWDMRDSLGIIEIDTVQKLHLVMYVIPAMVHVLRSAATMGKLDYGLGEQSPLAHLYDLNGYVLLLGVSYESCTSLHLAEYRTPHPQQMTEGGPILEYGQRVWKTYQDIELDSDPFPEIGADFEETGLVKTGLIGSAQCKLLPQRPAVGFATEWLMRKRQRIEGN